MNITGLTIEELWKLAYEQEQLKYKTVIQLLQLQDNTKLIIEEITRKELERLNAAKT